MRMDTDCGNPGIAAPCSWPQPRTWRTQVIVRGLHGVRLSRPPGAPVCYLCGLHHSGTRASCGISPHGVGHVVCGARGGVDLQICPQLLRLTYMALNVVITWLVFLLEHEGIRSLLE